MTGMAARSRLFTATTLGLYAAMVLIWGTTWIMMKFQLGVVAPSASLTYRYGVAGALILAGTALARHSLRLDRRRHLWCALQGLTMFSVNYWLTYLAAGVLTTGIISVFFAGVASVTLILSASIHRRLPNLRALIGAGLGVCGIALVFLPELSGFAFDGPKAWAGLLVAISVVMFAVGGLIGAHNQQTGVSNFATLGWAMIYGGAIMAGLTLLRGDGFAFDPSWQYVGSLAWLTLMGSGAVFLLYFTVIARIGAEKASYATVMFPLVALMISTVVEGYTWSLAAVLGVPLALLGNALVLSQPAVADGAEKADQADLPPPRHYPDDHPNAVEWPVNVVELPWLSGIGEGTNKHAFRAH